MADSTQSTFLVRETKKRLILVAKTPSFYQTDDWGITEPPSFFFFFLRGMVAMIPFHEAAGTSTLLIRMFVWVTPEALESGWEWCLFVCECATVKVSVRRTTSDMCVAMKKRDNSRLVYFKSARVSQWKENARRMANTTRDTGDTSSSSKHNAKKCVCVCVSGRPNM